jgi:hypothetical protein
MWLHLFFIEILKMPILPTSFLIFFSDKIRLKISISCLKKTRLELNKMIDLFIVRETIIPRSPVFSRLFYLYDILSFHPWKNVNDKSSPRHITKDVVIYLYVISFDSLFWSLSKAISSLSLCYICLI